MRVRAAYWSFLPLSYPKIRASKLPPEGVPAENELFRSAYSHLPPCVRTLARQISASALFGYETFKTHRPSRENEIIVSLNNFNARTCRRTKFRIRLHAQQHASTTNERVFNKSDHTKRNGLDSYSLWRLQAGYAPKLLGGGQDLSGDQPGMVNRDEEIRPRDVIELTHRSGVVSDEDADIGTGDWP